MKIVLIDKTEKVTCDHNKATLCYFFKIDEKSSSTQPASSKRKRDDQFMDEVWNNLLSEVLDGPTHLVVLLTLFKGNNDEKLMRIRIQPHGYRHERTGDNSRIIAWSKKESKYGEVKLSAFIEAASDKDGELMGFASIEGKKILRFCDDGFWFTEHSNVTDMESFESVAKINVKIIAEFPASIVFLNEVPPARRMLEEGIFSDVIICAGNGAEIKAHKSFLSACSPVLEAMFQSRMEESLTGRLDMSDSSEMGVNEFLRYIYYGDMTMAKEDITIAFELLCMGHKYEMRGLEARMLTLLLKRNNEDFSVGIAFQIYMFTRNIDFEYELKEKMALFLKEKRNELESLPEYKAILEESPNSEVAIELRKEFGNISLV